MNSGENKMKKILILAGYYTPSVKGGGPIQSIQNLVNNLSGKYEFYIVANDRDLGDKSPFENIETDVWIDKTIEKIYYTNYKNMNLSKLRKVINVSEDFDVLYLNSFFNFRVSIVPILLNKIKVLNINKVIVAPRGNLSIGALTSKNWKKTFYIKLSIFFKLYKGVVWHATAKEEKKEIKSFFGENSEVTIANNLTSNYSDLNFNLYKNKDKGYLDLVFISRIHPKKHLLFALNLLNEIEGIINFNIYGPIEDEKYWNECKVVIKSLPSNININYQGILNHNQVINVFQNHHVFLFPTLGENFGHVISEALMGGCLLIISDQTPWRNLENEKIGWDIELNNKIKFVHSIQECVDMDETEYNRLSVNAFKYGKKKANISENIISYEHLFK